MCTDRLFHIQNNVVSTYLRKQSLDDYNTGSNEGLWANEVIGSTNRHNAISSSDVMNSIINNTLNSSGSSAPLVHGAGLRSGV